MKNLVKNLLGAFGYDLVRIPYPYSLGRHLQELFSKFNVNIVFDVGAHYGEFAKSLRTIGYTGIIHSFEPVEESFSVLKSCQKNDRLWTAHKLALGSVSEQRRIHVAEGSEMSSFLNANRYSNEQFVEDSKVSHDEEVTVERLDTLSPGLICGIRQPSIYLKIDTQGWDYEVIKGAKRLLGHISAIQSELSFIPIYERMPTYIEVIEVLNSCGFYLSGIFPVKHDASGRLIEADCVFIKHS